MYLNLIPMQLQEKLELLKSKLISITDRAYIVGGAVRDMQIGISPKDLDIEIFGITQKQFDEFADSIGAVGVGKSFFVYRWHEIDISLPRKERKIGVGHTAFEVTLVESEMEATIRRDFKMNALMLNIFSGEILDFWGGIEDIKNKKISIINKNTFVEDSLRVLRAMQFSARFGFKISKKECLFMRRIDLSDISQTRIAWELEKMFVANYPHYGLYYFFALEISKKLFELEISRMEFFKLAQELAKNKNMHEAENKRFIFFYAIQKHLGLRDTYFTERIELPNIYEKRLKNQKRVPNNISDKFLVALSLKYPLKEWLGSYKKGIIERAKNLGVYEASYSGGIFARDVAREGFVGKAIAQETKKRLLTSIRENFK